MVTCFRQRSCALTSVPLAVIVGCKCSVRVYAIVERES